jgi:hypothetical protein
MSRAKVPLVYCPAIRKDGEPCGVLTVNVPDSSGKVVALWPWCSFRAQQIALREGSVEWPGGFSLAYQDTNKR